MIRAGAETLSFASSATERSKGTEETMIGETFARISRLSLDLADPRWSSRVMHDLLCDNLKLSRRVLTKNLLSRLADLGVGTNDVEEYTKNVMKQNVNNHTTNPG